MYVAQQQEKRRRKFVLFFLRALEQLWAVIYCESM